MSLPAPLCTPPLLASVLRQLQLSLPGSLTQAPHFFPAPTPPPCRSAAEADLAIEAGKPAAKKAGSDVAGHSDDEAPAARPTLQKTNSGRVLTALQRSASQLSLAAHSIKDSRLGRTVAKNRIFKWLTYGIT